MLSSCRNGHTTYYRRSVLRKASRLYIFFSSPIVLFERAINLQVLSVLLVPATFYFVVLCIVYVGHKRCCSATDIAATSQRPSSRYPSSRLFHALRITQENSRPTPAVLSRYPGTLFSLCLPSDNVKHELQR